MTGSKHRPYMPMTYTEGAKPLPGFFNGTDLAALRAVAKGKATPEQQVRALEFIQNRICQYGDLPYRPDELGGVRDEAFACGKFFVAQQIRKLTEIPSAVLMGKEPNKENQ